MSHRSSSSKPRQGHAQTPHSKSSGSGNKRPPAMRLFNAVPVTFRTSFIKAQCHTQNLHLRIGDEVVVETPRGPVMATVTDHVQRKMLPTAEVHRIVRKATKADLDQAIQNEAREDEAYRFAISRIRSRHMKMKLVRAQYMQDGSKIVFYFSADGRVDFRDLVKDLAHRFRTRIEMHQIGVRDGARMIGGVGPCGRELCCSTFLENFAPVSIRMAKDQGLTLNPKKVSGMCGRLMCCLVYEQQIYKTLKRRLPRPGTKVFSAHGEVTVKSIDVLTNRLNIELPDTNVKNVALSEISLEPLKEPTKAPRPEPDADYLWDDLLAQVSEAQDVDEVLTEKAQEITVPVEESQRSLAGNRRRTRRRGQGRGRSRGRSSNSNKEGEGEQKQAKTTPKEKQGKKENKSSDDRPKRRRRRRRTSNKEGRSKKPSDSSSKE